MSIFGKNYEHDSRHGDLSEHRIESEDAFGNICSYRTSTSNSPVSKWRFFAVCKEW